ncbi:MAG: hypothetical protein SWY16_23605 [Cyanobacteriota bacterium]|nr:hypothetical protein [Cyanobacteriota bacterium]
MIDIHRLYYPQLLMRHANFLNSSSSACDTRSFLSNYFSGEVFSTFNTFDGFFLIVSWRSN